MYGEKQRADTEEVMDLLIKVDDYIKRTYKEEKYAKIRGKCLNNHKVSMMRANSVDSI
jgi:hypothetical protein